MSKILPWRLAVLLSLCVVAALSNAETTRSPSKPIRIVAPFGAGGGDTSLRLLASYLAKSLGQAVIVDNKPGANGVVGAMEASGSAPDGHTLFYGSTTTLAANSAVMKKLPYDPGKDFAPITLVSDIPFMLVVNVSLPVTTVPQLVALARSSPKPLSFASANHTGLVAGSSFARLAGVELLHVPYKASPAALTDLIGGQVPMMFVDVAAGLPLVQAGKLRVVGVTSAARSTLLPDVPAITETLPGYEIVGWTAMVAPAGTRPELIRRIHDEIEKILSQPEVRKAFERVGFEPRTSSPAATEAFIRVERERWARNIKAAGIEPE